MTEKSVLRPAEMKAMADSAIEIMSSDNANFENAITAYHNIVNDDSINSTGTVAVKQVASDYATAVEALLTANELDIEDLRTLKSKLGSEDLVGADIIKNRDEAYESYTHNSNQYDSYKKDLDETPWWRIFRASYLVDMMQYYALEASKAEAEYDKWVEKEQKYDEIESDTCGLFRSSYSYRVNADEGFTALKLSYTGGGYTTDYDTSWRDDISKTFLADIEKLKEKWAKTDKNGNVEYDWDSIDEFLRADPDDITQLEYMAMAQVIGDMDTSNLNTLMNNATWKSHSDLFSTTYTTSRTIETAIQYYFLTAQVEAELTIFNEMADLTNEERAYFNNRLTKGIMLSLVANQMTSVSNGSNKYVTIKESYESDGITINYTAEVTAANITDQQLGSIMYDTVNNRTFTVYPCTDKQALDNYADKILLSTISPLGKEFSGFVVDQTANIVADTIFSKMGEGVATIAGGAAGFVFSNLVSSARYALMNYANEVNVKGVSDMTVIVNYMVSLGMYASLANADGMFSNETIYSCVKYDPQKLYVDIYVYNKDTGKNPPYTVADVKNAFNGGNPQVLEDYYNWYVSTSQDGDGKIDDFWDDLNVAYGEYKKTHPDAPKPDCMTNEQLRDLIEFAGK